MRYISRKKSRTANEDERMEEREDGRERTSPLSLEGREESLSSRMEMATLVPLPTLFTFAFPDFGRGFDAI